MGTDRVGSNPANCDEIHVLKSPRGLPELRSSLATWRHPQRRRLTIHSAGNGICRRNSSCFPRLHREFSETDAVRRRTGERLTTGTWRDEKRRSFFLQFYSWLFRESIGKDSFMLWGAYYCYIARAVGVPPLFRNVARNICEMDSLASFLPLVTMK